MHKAITALGELRTGIHPLDKGKYYLFFSSSLTIKITLAMITNLLFLPFQSPVLTYHSILFIQFMLIDAIFRNI